MPISEEQQVGRAKNAIVRLLERKLVVPKIYFDAKWFDRPVDVLAIDRDGLGDVHVVLLLARTYDENGESQEYGERIQILDLIRALNKIQAHHKYIGMVETKPDRRSESYRPLFFEESFSPDGIGRIGFLTIDVPVHGEPEAHIAIKPERFRAAITQIADEYVEHHTADWEIRA